MARVSTLKRQAAAPKKQDLQKSTKAAVTSSKSEKPTKAKGIDAVQKSLVRPLKRNGLKEEILALGGDDEDYELLKDLDSDVDSPGPSSSKNDVSISNDLEKFMKELNFSSVIRKDEEDEGGDDNEGNDEEDEEEGASARVISENDEKEVKQKKEGDKLPISIPKVGPNSRLLLEPSPQWYNLLPPLSTSKTDGPPSSNTLSTLQSRAASLHASELAAYDSATSKGANKLTSSSADAAFLQRVLSGGTLSDRLSALTLLAQSSPIHNTRALETLRGMGQKKGREESLKALRAIVDWWVGGGAPDRKLKYFIDQPLTSSGVTAKHLVLWFFEDWLKKYFYSILQILETLSLDPLPYVRMQTMSLIFALLRDKAEQEQNLLRLLVNKLGDSERPVASRASYHILQLLQAHPQMKAVVAREIASLALRPTRGGSASVTSTHTGATHLKFLDESRLTAPTKAQTSKQRDLPEKKDLQHEHAKYYGTITLNQIMLAPTESDRAVAVQLVGLYFELFKEILGQSVKPEQSATGDIANDDVDHSRYGKEKRKRQERKNGKGKGREEHDEGFSEVEDSNSRLISAVLTGVVRALPFAKLGLEDVEFSKHVDTLFLISHKSTFNISLQALRLIMQICQALKSSPLQSSSSTGLSASISDRYYRALYASLHDTRLNTSSKQAMYLNLLLTSLKVDTKKERVKAFVRRFIQLLVGSGNGAVEFVAGSLFLLGELFKAEPSLRDLLCSRQENSTRHSLKDAPEASLYDPKKRDPQFANAGSSPLWELYPLLLHYHPTIRLHASQLLAGKELTANADLSLNTLSHFLDRYVYKNPKKPKPKGSSAMQPSTAAPNGTSLRMVKGAQVDGTVNDETFWKKNVKDVAVDQVFFHKYFSQKSEKEAAKAEKVAKRKGASGASDDGGDGDQTEGEGGNEVDAEEDASSAEEDEDNEEAEIWEALKATNPDLRGDDDMQENPSDVEDDWSDEDVPSMEDDKVDEDDDEEDGLALAEESDAEDLVDLDDIIPGGLIDYESGASDQDEEDEWTGFDDPGGAKRKRGEKERDYRQKKKLRSLPTFATYEDYAKMIEDGPEDFI